MSGKRLYAVSHGDGNIGVSHIFPDYYVHTDEPFRLATLAMVTSFNPTFQQAALDAVEVDGDADYTVSAVIYNPEDVDPSEADPDEDVEMFCNINGAWQIVDVFPDDGPDLADPWHRPVYMSIEECFGEAAAALVPSGEG